MSTSDGQKRNALAVYAAFRIEGLEASLDRAREIAFQGELDAVGHHIEEAQECLAQIRLLHQDLQSSGRIGLLGGPQAAMGAKGGQ